jgi:hypothetical protein
MWDESGMLDEVVSGTLEAVSEAGERVAVPVEVSYVRRTDTYTLTLPDGTTHIVRGTAAADRALGGVESAAEFTDGLAGALRSLDPNVVSDLAKGAGLAGDLLEVGLVVGDVWVAFDNGGLGAASEAAGRGGVSIVAGAAGVWAGGKAGSAIGGVACSWLMGVGSVPCSIAGGVVGAAGGAFIGSGAAG